MSGKTKQSDKLRKDPYNIVITGVGGQGNVMASRVIGNMLVKRGYRVTIGETFGASQRGGSVMSHLRISKSDNWSPQIPKGKADLIVALEPSEAVRVLRDYGHAKVAILSNTRPIYPVSVISGEVAYPSFDELQGGACLLSGHASFIDATEEALAMGSAILSNIIMVGAVAGLKVLPLEEVDFKKVIAGMVPPDKLEINLKAFERGVKLTTNRKAGDHAGSL